MPGLALASVGLALRTGVEAGGSYATHRLPGILLISFGFGLAFLLLVLAVREYRSGASIL
ncbi:hypothetical protein [Streptomyces wedmorensis]